MKLQTFFFFFPQQTHGKIFLSVAWPAWKLATAASFPGSDSSPMTVGEIFKGDLNSSCYTGLSCLHAAGQCWCHPCVYGIAGRRSGGLVFQENDEMQQSNLGLLRVKTLTPEQFSLCQPWWSLPWWEEQKCLTQSWERHQISLTACAWHLQLLNAMKLGCRRWDADCLGDWMCNKHRGKYGCRISVFSGRIPLLLRKKKEKKIHWWFLEKCC